MKKAGLYIRVSTLEQALHGYSIGEQKERLIAFCKAHDWLIADIYVDSGYTGANIDRPGIQKLISEVGKLDIVLVYKLDRLSRSQRDTLHLIEDVFLPANVDFVSISQSFDTSTPFGKAMVGILSAFAQLEREQIKERTRMGKIARAKEGLFQGGVYFPIGYDYVSGKLTINEYEAVQVRKIYDWYIEGMSPIKIADKLRSEGYTNRYSGWSELSNGTGVLRVLCNDTYLGTLHYDDVTVEHAHEAIITPEQFEKANSMRLKRHEIYGDTAYVSKYLLTGMLFCGRCGARYYVKQNSKDYKYYMCYSRSKNSKRMAKADTCDNNNWKLDELEARVEAEVSRLLFEPRYLEILREEHGKKPVKQTDIRTENNVIKERIAELDKQINKLMDLFQADSIPADVLSARIDKLYREKVGLSERLSQMEPQAPKQDFDAVSAAAIIADLATVWETAEQSEKRLILETLINRITLDGENVGIEWSFLGALA